MAELQELERCNFSDEIVVNGDETEVRRQRWRKHFSEYQENLADPLLAAYTLPLPNMIGGTGTVAGDSFENTFMY